MKRFLLILLFAGSLLAVNAQGLEDIIVERYYVSNADDSTGSIGTLPVGSVTYRIFVDMAPGYKFQMLYGDPDHDMLFTTTSAFFNNEDRGAQTPNYTKNQAKFNTVMLDSWVSVGAACSGNIGVLKTEDDGLATVVNSDAILQNTDPLAGIPLTQQDGMIVGDPASITILGIQTDLEVLDDQSLIGNTLTSNNGTWASLYGSMGPLPSNRVLVGQFTTKGVFSFRFNIQIQDTTSLITYKYVHSNPLPDETMFPALTYSSNLPPTVALVNPANGAAFLTGETVNIAATASDFEGSVAKVKFHVDGNFLSEDMSSPFTAAYTAAYGTHVITAIAYDDMSDSATSLPVQIGVGSVEIEEVSNEDSFNVFPNPTSNTLMITISSENQESAMALVNLMDLHGRIIRSTTFSLNKGENQTEIDLSDLTAGQYIVRAEIGDRIYSRIVSRK